MERVQEKELGGAERHPPGHPSVSPPFLVQNTHRKRFPPLSSTALDLDRCFLLPLLLVMSVIRMEARNTKRKPLSDLTNTQFTPTSKSKTKPKPKPKLKSDAASTGSNTLNLSAQTPLPPNPKLASPQHSNSPDFESVNYDSTVYTRRQPVARTKDKQVDMAIEPANTKDKGKAVAVHSFSCPPIGRTTRFWDETEKEQSDVNENCSDLSKTCADRGPRSKKKRYSMPDLPLDFVEEQRKYFAEVDAFQLEEEAVSESDLE